MIMPWKWMILQGLFNSLSGIYLHGLVFTNVHRINHYICKSSIKNTTIPTSDIELFTTSNDHGFPFSYLAQVANMEASYRRVGSCFISHPTNNQTKRYS
jgi:hypothetical protein